MKAPGVPPQNPDQMPETDSSVKPGQMSRRDFLRKASGRFAALIGTAVLGNEITGGELGKFLKAQTEEIHDPIPEDKAEAALDEAEQKISEAASHAAEVVEAEHPELSDREKALRTLDYLGCGVFAFGVGSLLSGKHIAMLHYALFAAVMAAKYKLSNEEERHHLQEEFHSSAKAGLIIGGTVALAEGIKLDLDESYKNLAKRPATDRDRVALLTMLAGVVSPAITTVGSASVAKDMAQTLANGDMDKAAVLMQYISNSSGFILFGDPPFIAVAEKYGFKEGVLWQLRTMLPMGIYSLLSSAYKINLIRAKEDPKAQGMGAKKWALQETVRGFKDNAKVVKDMMAASLANAAKFYGLLDSKWEQDKNGLFFEIDKAIDEKFTNAVRLFKGEIDSSAHGVHEDGEGLDTASDEELGRRHGFMKTVEVFLAGEEDKSKELTALEHALKDKDFEEVERLLRELNVPPDRVTLLARTAHDLLHKATPAEETKEDKRPWFNRSLDYMDYLTDLGNLKASIGHNLGDIVDVFPFQAGCVPFLITGFKDMQKLISNTVDAISQDETARNAMKEACMFALIMMFSSVADNYVACKIGLELYPDKPELAVVPSIIGGGMSSVGNMANLALFNLEQMPLATSYIKDKWHMDIATFGFVWTQVLSKIQAHPVGNLLFGSTPKAMKAA